MEYAIEFNRLVRLEMETRSDDAHDSSRRTRLKPARPRGRAVTRATSHGRCGEPDWLRRRPHGRRRAAHASCRSRRTSSSRRTSTCGRVPVRRDPGLRRRWRTRRRSRPSFPREPPRSSRSPRIAWSPAGCRPRRPRSGVVVDTFSSVLRRDPDLLRGLLDGRHDAAAETTGSPRRHAAAYALGVLVHVPRRGRAGGADRPALGAGAAGPRPGHADRRLGRQERPCPAPRGAGCLGRASRRARRSRRSGWAPRRSSLEAGRDARRLRQRRTSARNTLAFVTRQSTVGESARPATGRWPSSAARCVKSRIDNRLVGRGARRAPGRDRLRRRRPAVRPDQLHAPRRSGHDRRPA